MATKVVMPHLSMAMTSGKVVEWKVEEGAQIQKGQVIFTIETEKVSYDIEASATGFLHQSAQLNESVPVDDVVAWIAESEEELLALQKESPAPAVQYEKSGAAKKDASPAIETPAQSRTSGKARISPAAKKMAEDRGVNWSLLSGTGPGGRIIKEDIEKAIEDARKGPAAAGASTPGEAWSNEVINGKRVKESIPLKGMRAAIADHMMKSLQNTAQLTAIGEIDMTEMIRIRNLFLAKEAEIGFRISFTDIMVYILARALKENPRMNASQIGDRVILWEDINIGVAVSVQLSESETGLIVPVLRNADKKSLVGISKDIKALTQRARAMQLLPEDMGGGTFTLTNFGVFGGGYVVTTPIINYPEAAILGTGAVVDRPVVKDGQVVVRSVMPVSLTFDHRLLDGAPLGGFALRVKELMENPQLILLGV